MKHDNAFLIANIWLRRLRPFIDRGEICGSIRRKKPEVKDIELVLLPKIVTQTDLFGKASRYRHPEFAETFQDPAMLVVNKGNASRGKYTQVHIIDHKINMDVFIANERNYGLIKLIRIGDADFSRIFIGTILPRHGYRSEDGLLKEDEKVIPVNEEEELFNLCRIPFIKPEHRNINAILS